MPFKKHEDLVYWCKVNPIRRMLTTAKYRAKKAELPFELSLEDIKVPDVCPALGTPLKFFGGFINDSPSIDRVDNKKGYTKDNVRIISARANFLKRDATLSELESIVKYMQDHASNL